MGELLEYIIFIKGPGFKLRVFFCFSLPFLRSLFYLRNSAHMDKTLLARQMT